MIGKIYCPKKLDELSFNTDVTQKLKSIKLQNFIIYGCPGSGKLTRVYCHLAEIFGKGVYNNQLHTYNLNKGVDIMYKISNYHVEICPSDYGTKDKDIIINFIGELAESHNIITHGVKIFLIKDADRMSYKAQTILRNIIEKTTKTARYIFTCKNINKIIHPLKSRFYILRNPLPNHNDTVNILKYLGNKIGSKTSTRAINIIIQSSLKLTNMINLSYVINIFQLSYISGKYIKYEFNFTQYIDKLINNIEKKFSVTNIQTIREIIYNIYTSNINLTIVIKYIVDHFINRVEDIKYKFKIIQDASRYQHLMCSGNKEPLYLEAFILSIMDILEHTSMIETKLSSKKNIKTINKIKKST